MPETRQLVCYIATVTHMCGRLASDGRNPHSDQPPQCVHVIFSQETLCVINTE